LEAQNLSGIQFSFSCSKERNQTGFRINFLSRPIHQVLLSKGMEGAKENFPE